MVTETNPGHESALQCPSHPPRIQLKTQEPMPWNGCPQGGLRSHSRVKVQVQATREPSDMVAARPVGSAIPSHCVHQLDS